MKIGITVHPFNYNMRVRRKELGYTQRSFAQFVGGIDVNDVSAIETLRKPGGDIGRVKDKLTRVAAGLEVDFDWLFPQDYLDMLQRDLLPKHRGPILWCKEIPLEQLPMYEHLLLDSPEEILRQNGLTDTMRSLVDNLPSVDRAVIEMRYGLGDGESKTLEETAIAIGGVTRERVRQIEARALRRLRHRKRSEQLEDYKEDSWEIPRD